MLTKTIARRQILDRLRKQKEEIRHKKSLKIKKKLFALDGFKRAKTILFYLSFDGEVETDRMIKDAKKEGKKIAVPICDRKKRRLIPCFFSTFSNLRRGVYGVRQPKIKKIISNDKIDLVIVPGVAFDKKGNRLGRGLGYYDRFLTKLSSSITRIGIAFDFQILKNLPELCSYDQPVDKVISN